MYIIKLNSFYLTKITASYAWSNSVSFTSFPTFTFPIKVHLSDEAVVVNWFMQFCITRVLNHVTDISLDLKQLS